MSKTYVVTGANRGIGLELARQLKGKGHTVIGTAREPGAAAELKGFAERVLALDIADERSVESFARELGDTPVDVLINNAGIGPNEDGIESLDLDAMERAFAVNSVGALRVTRGVLKNLRAAKTRTIVSVTSTMGSIELTGGSMGGGSYAYRASKAALNMLMRTLAGELREDGFTCFVICPGWVRTRMGGENAPLSVEESASGILRVVEGAGPAESGRFLNHRGETVPW